MRLSDIATYVKDKVSSRNISLEEYVTTDCILQNKRGREIATNLPPQPCSLIHYKPGDVLIANIRPYLKRYGMQTWRVAHPLMFLFFVQKKDILRSICLQHCFKTLSLLM